LNSVSLFHSITSESPVMPGTQHVDSHNPVASKAHFMLMLTAHLFQQLLTRGRLGTVFRAAFHTFLHYGKQMLEALKNQPLPTNLDPPGQIRLSTT